MAERSECGGQKEKITTDLILFNVPAQPTSHCSTGSDFKRLLGVLCLDMVMMVQEVTCSCGLNDWLLILLDENLPILLYLELEVKHGDDEHLSTPSY